MTTNFRWSLASLWRSSEEYDRHFGPWMHAGHLAFCGGFALIPFGLFTRREDRGHQWPGAERQHREALLTGVALLIALPFAYFWIILALSFVRRPVACLWALGGVLAVFLPFKGLSVALSQAGDAPIDLLENTRFVYGHVGVGLGGWLSSTSLAQRLVPGLAVDRSTLSERSIVGSKADDEESNKPPNDKNPGTMTLSQSQKPDPYLTVLQTIFMIWTAAFIIISPIRDLLPTVSTPKEQRSTGDAVDLILFPATLALSAALYVCAVYYYAKYTTQLLWECLCGGFVGIASIALLRLTTPFDTWQSWTIDGALAFVCMNIGMFAGVRSRIRPVAPTPTTTSKT